MLQSLNSSSLAFTPSALHLRTLYFLWKRNIYFTFNSSFCSLSSVTSSKLTILVPIPQG